MKHTGASIKREAVVTAIVDFNRPRRLVKLVARLGTSEHLTICANFAPNTARRS